MSIKTPKVHCFYPPSKNEKEKLLLWIPKEEYPKFFPDRKKQKEMKKYYPDGIEIEVSSEGFAEHKINMEMKPEKLKKAYHNLVKQDSIPKSGLVDGQSLKKDAKAKTIGIRTTVSRVRTTKKTVKKIRKLPEPKMTDGDDALTVFSKIR